MANNVSPQQARPQALDWAGHCGKVIDKDYIDADKQDAIFDLLISKYNALKTILKKTMISRQ